jgi:hypothetical protein
MQAMTIISNLVLPSLILVMLLVIREPLAFGRVLARPDTSSADKSLPTGRLFHSAGIHQERASR